MAVRTLVAVWFKTTRALSTHAGTVASPGRVVSASTRLLIERLT